MKTRQEIKFIAKELLSRQRGTAILLAFVPMIIGLVIGIFDGLVFIATDGQGNLLWGLIYLIIMLPLVVLGVNMIGEFIKIWNGQVASVGELFGGFKVNFLRKLGGMMWMSLWVFLWSLLLVIPGIVKSFAYFFTPNILADMPNVTATQALKISMKITKGYKLDIFVFVLSFLGWFILSIFTFGILAILFVTPYFYIADAGLYIELKNRALAEGVLTKEEIGAVDSPVNAN